ncbi:hypothetical protein FACS189435_1300 [Bacteroidia bacterium]|nr:hypothetical protein FACS189435_1300 [Bacteroidia bacterium]
MFAMALLTAWPIVAGAQSKWEVAPAADLVSSYVWRGVYQTGASFQPALNVSYGGLSLGFWGSTDFASAGVASIGGIPKEFDFTLGYSANGFSISATDYWWAGEGSKYGSYRAFHFIEGSIGYSFGSFGLSWNTMLKEGEGEVAGEIGGENSGYKQQYSTYVAAAYDFEVGGAGGVACTASIGVSPWTGIYHKEDTKGFAVSTISLKASKEIKVTDSFSLPVFAEAIFAPNQDNVFLVFGINL